jgi:hypothetical protein
VFKNRMLRKIPESSQFHYEELWDLSSSPIIIHVKSTEGSRGEKLKEEPT